MYLGLTMVGDKENPGGIYVARREFNKRFGKVELALFGVNGRGGMVKDISHLTHDMKEVKNVLNAEKEIRKRKTELSNKWKITIYGSIVCTCGLVCVEIIKLIAQAI